MFHFYNNNIFANKTQMKIFENFCGWASEASETTLYSGRNHPLLYFLI